MTARKPPWKRKPYASLSWKPVRRGGLYCSPACGGRCTYTAFETATKHAKRLAALLGSGWKPHVHENLGWHYCVANGVCEVHEQRTYHGRIDYYLVLFNTQPQVVTRSKTAKSALRKAFTEARRNLRQLKHDLERITNSTTL